MKQIAILLPALVLALLMALAAPAWAEDAQPTPVTSPSTQTAGESAAPPESAGQSSALAHAEKSPAEESAAPRMGPAAASDATGIPGSVGHIAPQEDASQAETPAPETPSIKPPAAGGASAQPSQEPALDEPDYQTLTAQVQEVRPLYTASGEPMEGHRSLWVMLDDEGGEAVLSMTDSETITTGKAPADIAPGDKVAFTYDAKAPVVLVYPPRYTPVKVEVVP